MGESEDAPYDALLRLATMYREHATSCEQAVGKTGGKHNPPATAP